MFFTKKERRKLFLGVCTALVAAGVLGIFGFFVPTVRDWFVSLAKDLLAFGSHDLVVHGWVVILLAIFSLSAVIQFFCWIAIARRSPHIRLFRSLARDEQLVLTLLAKSDFGLSEGELSDLVPVSPQRFLYFIDRLVHDLGLAKRTEPVSGGAFWALSTKGREVATANHLSPVVFPTPNEGMERTGDLVSR
jgi:hypothetical protein